MNNEDAFFQLILRPMQGLTWRTDFHNIRVTEKTTSGTRELGQRLKIGSRLWLCWSAHFGKRALFQIIETTFNYNLNKRINIQLFFSHVFGDSIVDQIFSGDDANFRYLEVTLQI